MKFQLSGYSDSLLLSSGMINLNLILLQCLLPKMTYITHTQLPKIYNPMQFQGSKLHGVYCSNHWRLQGSQHIVITNTW